MRREKCLKCERLRREREFIESLPASKQLVLVAASWGLGMLALGRASGGHSFGGGGGGGVKRWGKSTFGVQELGGWIGRVGRWGGGKVDRC